MRQRARIQRIGLGQLPGGARAIPGLPRVDDDDRQARHGQRGRGGPLEATGGFQHHQGGVEALQPFHQRHDSIGIVGNGPPLPSGAQRNSQLGFRDLNPHKARHVTQTNSCLPALADTGSRAPDNCTGLRSPGRDDPRSAPVSADQG